VNKQEQPQKNNPLSHRPFCTDSMMMDNITDLTRSLIDIVHTLNTDDVSAETAIPYVALEPDVRGMACDDSKDDKAVYIPPQTSHTSAELPQERENDGMILNAKTLEQSAMDQSESVEEVNASLNVGRLVDNGGMVERDNETVDDQPAETPAAEMDGCNDTVVDAEQDSLPSDPLIKCIMTKVSPAAPKAPCGGRRRPKTGGGSRLTRTGSTPRVGRSSHRKRERDNTSEHAADIMQLAVIPDNVSLGCMRFQWKRRRMMSIPDIGATAQSLAKATTGSDPIKFVPNIIKNIPGMEISVFHVLDEELEQPFTLNNGMILQEAMYYWLANYRSSSPAQFDVVHNLYQARESLLVWWEGRSVRIWCWPYELRPALVCMARSVLTVLVRIVCMELTEPVCSTATDDPESGEATTTTTSASSSSSSHQLVAAVLPPPSLKSTVPCKTPHVYTSFDDPLCLRCTYRSISTMRTDFWPITIVSHP
jgi:hypothetical protein